MKCPTDEFTDEIFDVLNAQEDLHPIHLHADEIVSAASALILAVLVKLPPAKRELAAESICRHIRKLVDVADESPSGPTLN
jgi:hypothetical protein